MKLPLLTVITAVALAGCAQLNDGLRQVNDALGQANASLSGSAASTGQAMSAADKVTSEYEIRHLKLINEEFNGSTGIRFSGTAMNKSAKNIRIAISVPAYDSQGNYDHPVYTELDIPAHERIKIDQLEPYSIRDGQKLNMAKITYRVTRF